MAKFNITNSKIDQLNDKGDNIKITGNTGPIAFSTAGDVAHASGEGAKAIVKKGEDNIFAKIWGWIKARILGI